MPRLFKRADYRHCDIFFIKSYLAGNTYTGSPSTPEPIGSMTFPSEIEQLAAAHSSVRRELLEQRSARGSWEGRLSSSPLSTATAISALVLAEQGGTSRGMPAYTEPGDLSDSILQIYQGDLSEMIVHSMHWLAQQQNEDGGWGDTDRSLSNIATTMLVQAAFHMTGVPVKYEDLLQRADEYVKKQGGLAALKQRYEGDKTFVVPILTNCALADMIPWRKVPSLPFELASLPQEWYHRLHLPVVSYALPALVAIGQARHHHAPSRNPIMRWIRNATKKRTLEILTEMQPASGGFLEATPLTSFVVMSLASMGLGSHPVVRRGVEFLLSSVREDGSWAIDTNLATWNTSQAVTALDWNLDDDEHHPAECSPAGEQTLDWLLGCQHTEKHRATGAAPGGWAWTDLSGGIPDADDTAAALLALSGWHKRRPHARAADVTQAARAGVNWLLDLQNSDGGWPTFCRGWGRLPFDRSSTDITAHALRAIHAWRTHLQQVKKDLGLEERIEQALNAGAQYLRGQQQPDGSWLPLWFGNQHHPAEANPVYGTAKVLMMCSELGWHETEMARRGVIWLVKAQLASGGWGTVLDRPAQRSANDVIELASSVEETALAVDALLPYARRNSKYSPPLQQAVSWLSEAVLEGRHLEPAPIGFYFAKLWYYEQLYPLIFATRALGAACRAAGGLSPNMQTSHTG